MYLFKEKTSDSPGRTNYNPDFWSAMQCLWFLKGRFPKVSYLRNKDPCGGENFDPREIL